MLYDKWRCRASGTPTSFLKMVAVFGLGTLYQEGTPFANRNIVQGQGDNLNQAFVNNVENVVNPNRAN